MKTPKRLEPLIEDGLIDEVISQLMSGKEAQVFIVRSGERFYCAKVYKEAKQRSFKQAAQYREGRAVRDSRRARAMSKRTSFGQKEQETAWQSAEVDALHRLARAHVNVPQPHFFLEGVLLMDLVVDAEGYAAPRLGDVSLTPAEALDYHGRILKDIVRMLCAGLVHGDLSEFNILLGESGPVIIDLPQAVDAAANNNASRMLERDVNNMSRFFGQFAPELLNTAYGKEIWGLFAQGKLTVDTPLTGRVAQAKKPVNVQGVMRVIDAAKKEALERQRYKDGLNDRQ